MISIAAPAIGESERASVDEVLQSGMIASGEQVDAFESEFAGFSDAEHGVATANGTAALHAALEALDVGAGDTVVTTPFSFVATANAVRLAGAEPVFADIDPETYLLDPDAVESVLETRDDVAAVLPVHLYGLPADMPRFQELAEAYDVAVVEDAAQAHGATIDGGTVGSFGDAACFSFYPTKNMTTGEGGMVTTDDDDLADRVRSYIDHGRDGDQYGHVRVGHNLRMTDIAAAIGREQLARLPAFTERRRRNAHQLTEILAEAPVEPQAVPDGRRHVYHQYTIATQDREGLREQLEAADVQSRVYYPTPIHRLEAYEGYEADVPDAERAAQTVLSLPVHPGLDDRDVERVGRAVREAVEVPQ